MFASDEKIEVNTEINTLFTTSNDKFINNEFNN